MDICLKFINGPKIAGVHFVFRITPQREVKEIKFEYLSVQSVLSIFDNRHPGNFCCEIVWADRHVDPTNIHRYRFFNNGFGANVRPKNHFSSN